ncbi:MAG: tRNA-dihydrouridine synthase [Candidatus Saccharibacteria bacterium]|nr:tRNA-dihydrouridine synthase [Candidatus Saccharibacteria bacterium]
MSTNQSFWHNLPQPFFVLAPMEAVTDVIFRHVVAQAGAPDVWFSEFTNATGWVYAGQKAIGGRLVKTADEQPIVAQIWGGEPGDMEQLALHCSTLGFHGIDINMGCPAKSAIKSGGAALIRRPDVAVSAIKAAKIAKLPVSVKTRLGYSRVDEWKDWLTTLLEQDIVNLTIHLRTKKEMSKVPAHFELIDDIIALRDAVAPHTLLTINGDIRDRAHGLTLAAAHPGVNGIMIGRGVFHDPFCFRMPHQLPTTIHRTELISLLHTHLDLFDHWQPHTNRPFETLKRFFKIYIRDFDGAKELREQLMHCKNTDEVRACLMTFCS